jgi:hypothetical protein
MVASAAVLPQASLETRPTPINQEGWVGCKRHIKLPNGVRLAYVETGNSDGSPVVLLHGYTDSSRLWTIVAPWLADY